MGIGQLLGDCKPQHVFQSRPGRVGPVGEVVVKPRFRQSTPDMPWAYDPYWTGHRADKCGSNVQDGCTRSFDSGGGPANVNNGVFKGNRSFKHQYGYTYHDIQSPDKLTEPVLSWLGDVSWRRKIARPQIIKRTGQLFSIKPMGYSATGPARGGNYPVATTAGGIDPASTGPEDTEPETQNNPLRRGVNENGVQRLIQPLANMIINPVLARR